MTSTQPTRCCIRCNLIAPLDQCGWCQQCQRELAYGRGDFHHLGRTAQNVTENIARLQAGLAVDRCSFRLRLAEVTG